MPASLAWCFRLDVRALANTYTARDAEIACSRQGATDGTWRRMPPAGHAACYLRRRPAARHLSVTRHSRSFSARQAERLASAGAIWLGITKGFRESVYTGSFFFVILLFYRFVEWWWDWMPRYLFFLIVALTAVAVVLVLKRLRAAIADLDAAATDERLKADRMELAGHLALLERRYDASIAEFSESARLRSAAYDYRGTVRALAKAGKASEAAGKPGQASVHYLRAGRSALHQGARERAHALLTQAYALAETAGDADTAREAQLYLTRLEDSGPAGSPDS